MQTIDHRQSNLNIWNMGIYGLDFMCYRADTTNQTTWTINIGTKTRTCSTKIFIRRSQSNLSAKASRLSLALLFWAATRIYLTGMTDLVKNLSHSDELICTHPIFEPFLKKIHYFFHHSRKFFDSGAQFIEIWNLLKFFARFFWRK